MAPTRIHRTATAVALVTSVLTGCVDASPPAVPTPVAGPSQPTDPTRPAGSWYVAMGDSAAAAPLVPDQAAPVGCLKSTNDYPSVLARRIRAASFTDVTCSGARTEDLVSRSQSTRTGSVPPQLDAVTSDTQLVTITIGGNDVDLPAQAMRCRRATLDEPPCSAGFTAGGSDGTDSISQSIDGDSGDWSGLLAEVRAKAPDARVIVVGYGTYVRPEGCFPEQPINPVDAAFFQSKVDELDDGLRQVTEAGGAEFFDTRALSVGHDICAAPGDRYIEGFVPIRPAAPLHPNAAGAAAFGTALADYLETR